MKNNYYIKNLNCSKNKYQNIGDHFQATNLVTALQKKNIIVSSLNHAGKEENKKINMAVFIRAQKLKDYKLRLKQQIKPVHTTFKAYKLFQNKNTTFRIINLNSQVPQAIYSNLFERYKAAHGNLFIKRVSLFNDFIKVLALAVTKQISIWALIYVLSLIFRKLPKRRHTAFTAFLQEVFDPITEDPNNSIIGVKFIISGRLRGKPRASFVKYKSGKIPLQQESADIQHAQTHIYTVYGCFGLKLWINYKK